MRCLIQARMGSSRLPGKVLMEAAGKPLLAHLVERLEHAETLTGVHVITSTLKHDDPIVEWATSAGVSVFRGSEDDVLDRYYQAAIEFEADHIVRVTADCPIIDPAIVDRAVRLAREQADGFDLVTNRHPITFPDGMDVDVIPFASLERAWLEARSQHQREHVIPFFWEEGLIVRNFEADQDYFYSHRWTLDYLEDYELLKTIIDALYVPGKPFTLHETLDFLDANPQLSEINHMHLPVRD